MSALQNVSITLSNSVAGATGVTYSLHFTPPGGLGLTDNLRFSPPVAFNITSITQGYEPAFPGIAGTHEVSGFTTSAFTYQLLIAPAGAVNDLECDFYNYEDSIIVPADAPAVYAVDNWTNPLAAGNYTISVFSSIDTDAVNVPVVITSASGGYKANTTNLLLIGVG